MPIYDVECGWGGRTTTSFCFTHHYSLPLPGTATCDPLQIPELGPSSSGDTPDSGNWSELEALELQSSGTLRFRSEIELRASLRTYGFTVEQVHGGWRREPVGAGDGELVVLARAR